MIRKRLLTALLALTLAAIESEARATILPPGVETICGTYVGSVPDPNGKAIPTRITLDDAGVNAGYNHGDFVFRQRTSIRRGTWSLVPPRTTGY